MSDLVELIKKAALDAMAQAKPVEILFGSVASTTPLSVRVNQKLLLNDKCLVLTSSAGALQSGDRVVLLQCQGGQKFLILDRVVM